MNLLIDVGNSRIKWARSEADHTVSDQISLAHGGEIGDEWLKLVAAGGTRPTRILIANVAGARIAETLTRLLSRKYSVAPAFAAAAGTRAPRAGEAPRPSRSSRERSISVDAAYPRTRPALSGVDSST